MGATGSTWPAHSHGRTGLRAVHDMDRSSDASRDRLPDAHGVVRRRTVAGVFAFVPEERQTPPVQALRDRTQEPPGPFSSTRVASSSTPPLQRSERSGAACWVDFPHELKEPYGKGIMVPVRATRDGRVVYRGSLAMTGGTQPMLLCRKDVLAQPGKDVGDVAQVTGELDVAPREVVEPEALMEALRAVPGDSRR
jgi:hypothetical protein